MKSPYEKLIDELIDLCETTLQALDVHDCVRTREYGRRLDALKNQYKVCAPQVNQRQPQLKKTEVLDKHLEELIKNSEYLYIVVRRLSRGDLRVSLADSLVFMKKEIEARRLLEELGRKTK